MPDLNAGAAMLPEETYTPGGYMFNPPDTAGQPPRCDAMRIGFLTSVPELFYKGVLWLPEISYDKVCHTSRSIKEISGEAEERSCMGADLA